MKTDIDNDLPRMLCSLSVRMDNDGAAAMSVGGASSESKTAETMEADKLAVLQTSALEQR